MNIPNEIIREIIIRTDYDTIITYFSVSNECYKLSQDIDFWSDKADKDELCDKSIFEELYLIGSIIRKEITSDIIVRLTEEVTKSDNLEVIKIFDDLRLSFMTHGKICKVTSLFITSVMSLYKLFYEIKNWNKRCKYKCRSKNGTYCMGKSLPLCDYCSICCRGKKIMIQEFMRLISLNLYLINLLKCQIKE